MPRLPVFSTPPLLFLFHAGQRFVQAARAQVMAARNPPNAPVMKRITAS